MWGLTTLQMESITRALGDAYPPSISPAHSPSRLQVSAVREDTCKVSYDPIVHPKIESVKLDGAAKAINTIQQARSRCCMPRERVLGVIEIVTMQPLRGDVVSQNRHRVSNCARLETCRREFGKILRITARMDPESSDQRLFHHLITIRFFMTVIQGPAVLRIRVSLARTMDTGTYCALLHQATFLPFGNRCSVPSAYARFDSHFIFHR